MGLGSESGLGLGSGSGSGLGLPAPTAAAAQGEDAPSARTDSRVLRGHPHAEVVRAGVDMELSALAVMVLRRLRPPGEGDG